MSTTQDLGDLMSARRAELEGVSPSPEDAVEVIPPTPVAGGTPPETVTPAVAAPAAPVATLVPADSAAPALADAHFPTIPPKVLGGLPYAANYMKLAKTIHATELVPKAFAGRPDAIMAAMMYGYELGLGPMQALNGLHVIEGKVGQDAELMRALITEQGHLFVVQTGENNEGEPWASVYCRRKDWPADIPTAEFIWTLDDGRRAGLVEWYEKWITQESGRKRKLTWNPHGDEPRPDWLDSGGGKVEFKQASSWANYGADMCVARATARAARANFADVLKGMSYTPEELAEFDGVSRQTEEAPPSPPQTPPSSTPGSEISPSDSPEASDSSSPEAGAPDGPPSDAGPSSTPTSEPAPRPAKKASRAKKEAPPKEPEPTPGAATAPASPETTPAESTAPAPATAPIAASDSIQPDLEGNEPAPDPAPEEGEAGVVRELARSLRALLGAKPQADRQVITGFLHAHFPDRTAEQLTEPELTMAINIAAGWPESAEKFPVPDAD